ncbi:DNA-binding protein [Halomonas korlensis]|uniref:Replication region DNA-binding N-term n=1 Tax=Halomonas korlensis TaxID=463301 RepID=A0A1I7KLT6_9GAMM|nr:DNA-binding protein [Halomonas korlensis]SFU98407.1 replication region DNA-binding N-term [Halomonas korlensis]
MSRPGITYDQVSAAANALVAEGTEPTIQKVRSRLGTGSPNTVHRHLTAWRQAQPATERKAPELPGELQAALIREIERQAAEARSDAEHKQIEAQEEAAELSQAGEELEEANSELEERNTALDAENQRLGALAEERRGEIDKLTAEIVRERESAEKTRLELAQVLNKAESQQERVDELKIQLKTAEEATQSAKSEAAAASQDRAVAIAERDAANRQLDERVARIEALDKHVAELRVEQKKAFDELKKEHRDEVASIKADYQSRLEAAQKSMHGYLKKSESLSAELADLQSKYSVLSEKFTYLKSGVNIKNKDDN